MQLNKTHTNKLIIDASTNLSVFQRIHKASWCHSRLAFAWQHFVDPSVVRLLSAGWFHGVLLTHSHNCVLEFHWKIMSGPDSIPKTWALFQPIVQCSQHTLSSQWPLHHEQPIQEKLSFYFTNLLLSLTSGFISITCQCYICLLY